MYLRRLRTIMDEQLQPPGTPYDERYFERRIDELHEQMQLDVALDAEAWPVEWGMPQTFAQAIDIIKNDYLAVRRVHLYRTYGRDGKGIIPDAQPQEVVVQLGDVGFAPLDGDPGSEYLTLVNRNPYPVDISNWTVKGEVRYTFRPGVVLPTGGTLYVARDVVAFRQRATSPQGDEGRFVQGGYRGQVTKNEGTLRLYDDQGRIVDSVAFADLRPFGQPRTASLSPGHPDRAPGAGR
jgi:hypothetical protein